MASINDIKAAIDNLLNLSGSKRLLQLNSNTCERAYEAFVLSLCVKAVRKQGGQATLMGILSGPNPQTIVFRGAPGSMSSRSQDFCYVDCSLGSKNFEIHVDVEYFGQSGATHEIDVSIYDHDTAESVRINNKSPRTNKPLLMAFECKFYTTSPGVSLARTFVGLISDCTPNILNGFISNKSTNNLDRFLSKKSSPEPFTDLTPLDPDSISRFINYVA